jgi:adenine-specific DNA-methyltransferase
MQNLLEDLKELLQQDERLVVDGKLLKNKIIELALQLDPVLIKMLLSHESIKKHFFQDVEGRRYRG